MKTRKIDGATRIAALALLFLSLIGGTAVKAGPPLPGAIFTTDSTCSGVDLNIYGSKDDVYLNGGSSHPGAASLPDGSYYVQVTNPPGSLILGSSVGSGNPTPFVVVNGVVQGCYQLSAIVNSGSSGFTTAGYDDTDNPGGEYKVWVSNESSFTNNSTKTDNFKVRAGGGGPGQTAALCVNKFYDANANGVQDNGEPNLVGWEYCVVGNNNFSALRFTFDPPRCLIVDPDLYCVKEGTPIQTNWVHTTTTQDCFTLNAGDTHNTSFGNACLGPGGGLTLGFWSNKNGQNTETASDLCFLNTLCLRNATGANFDPIVGCPSPTSAQLSTAKSNLNTWLLNATAVNMAYMLSAQLTAMELNVGHGFVSGNALVYEPCLTNFGYPTGFISINDLMTAANAELCAHAYTPSGDPNRAKQECLKNALDDANNNRNFVQSSPCPFSFSFTDTCPFANP